MATSSAIGLSVWAMNAVTVFAERRAAPTGWGPVPNGMATIVRQFSAK